MSFEEEFDRIIQRKTEEADFPFDESNWEKARGMLDAARNTKRAGFLPGVAALVFLGVGLGAAAWWYLQPASKIAQAVVQSPAQPSASLVAPEATSAPAVAEEAASVLPRSQAGKPVAVSPQDNHRTAGPTGVANASQPAAGHTDSQIMAAASDAGDAQRQPDLEPGQQANGTSNTSRPLAAGHAIDLNGAASAPAETLVQEPTQNEVAMPEQLRVEPLPPTVPAAQPLASADLTLAALNWMGYFDDDYYKPEKYKKHYLNIEAGTSYLYGWEVASKRDGQGFNWFGGFNYGMYIHRKGDLSIGLQAYNIGNMSQAFFDVSKTEFGFSSVTTRTTIAVNALYYLAVPVKFTWQINSAASFGVGCNLGLLMDSRNTMRTTIKSEQGTRETTTTTKGYYNEGMNPTHIQLSGFYKTRVNDRFALNAELLWAPLDIFKYAGSKVNTSNMLGLRLGVHYTLFDK